MMALTIRQPHASAIACGIKLVENRTWETNYRGPLLIHAGMQDAKFFDEWCEAYRQLDGRVNFDNLPRGVIVAKVQLVDITTPDKLPGSSPVIVQGPLCWLLDDVEPILSDVPIRGMQRLFDVEWSGGKLFEYLNRKQGMNMEEKPKRGRPRRAKDVADVEIRIRFTQEEKQRLQSIALPDVSTFVRKAVFAAMERAEKNPKARRG